ncbi:ATP-grasp domain-containing protein [Xylanimonas sp. McL0601]|uniref:ATP-grasp domain-containing protein n=1 Tax=Xylanimonas sp. McL0601 TaxID=3414739 RepID=UPI003CF83471
MTTKRVALATCSDLPALSVDDKPLVPALADRGVTAEPAVWDDPTVDWDAYDLVVVRSTWDYAPRHDEFLAWAETVPRLENPAPVLRWNTDKSYLRALEAASVPVIPTVWLDPARHFSKRAVHTRMPAFGDFVVKPVVSAGAKDTGRYIPISAQSRSMAISHTMELLDSGRWVMIQPYVTSVDSAGETCLTFVDGVFQHAARKHALLTGPSQPTKGLGLYLEEKMSAVAATPEQLKVAQRALEVAGAELGLDGPLLYARVDLVTGEEGPLVIELELTEPSLWMAHSGPVPTLTRFADAIAARA